MGSKMSRDQVVGAGILLASAVIIIAYLYLVFLTEFSLLSPEDNRCCSCCWCVSGYWDGLAILWQQLLLPKPIEEIEKEIEEEMKKIEEEEKKETKETEK